MSLLEINTTHINSLTKNRHMLRASGSVNDMLMATVTNKNISLLKIKAYFCNFSVRGIGLSISSSSKLIRSTKEKNLTFYVLIINLSRDATFCYYFFDLFAFHGWL
ncbi:hypothetical protein ACJX0J_041306 [Zea mays]